MREGGEGGSEGGEGREVRGGRGGREVRGGREGGREGVCPTISLCVSQVGKPLDVSPWQQQSLKRPHCPDGEGINISKTHIHTHTHTHQKGTTPSQCSVSTTTLPCRDIDNRKTRERVGLL